MTMAHAYDDPAMVWVPVHKTHQPCPICGRPDFCSVNARWVLCMRTPSSHQTSNGGWLHDRPGQGEPLPAPPTLAAPLAPIAQRDRAYRLLWSLLPLTAPHATYLSQRGLATLAPYRSNPVGQRAQLARRVAARCDVAGVPGFHASDRGTLVWGGRPGILIPVRDLQGRIQAVQVRADEPVASDDRYRWVTSAHRGGASPGTPVHVVSAGPASHGQRVWLTEGVFKATYAAQIIHEPWLAVAGVSNVAPVFPLLAALGAQVVVIAFDMDMLANRMVAYHTHRLAARLLTAGYQVVHATWPARYKGIDDCLIARVRPTLTRIADPTALPGCAAL